MPLRPSASRRGAAPALLLAMALACPAVGQGVRAVIDIARMPVGTAPVGFQFGRTGQGAAGDWRIVDDPSAAAGKAIAQVSQDRTDYRFPLAIYQPLSAKDLEATLRFKPVGGRVDQAGGIAVRVTSPDDYYVVRANALENNVRFYRVAHGRREQIEGIDIPVPSGQWHALGLRAEGSRFTVSFDGRVLFAAFDDRYADTGRVALWTKADSVTHFDTIAITPLE